MVIARGLFDGRHSPKEIACFLHLKARGRLLAEPWQIEQLMQASRTTTTTVLASLTRDALVTNYGTRQEPRWGVAGLQNLTFKKTTSKKSTFKNSTPTHPLGSSLQSTPHTHKSQHGGSGKDNIPGIEGDDGSAAPQIERLVACTVAGLAMGADGGATALRRPMAMDGPNTPAEDINGVGLSKQDLAVLKRLGADPEELFDRTMVAKAQLEKRGKRMGSVPKYMMEMARRDFSQTNGVLIGVVEELATGNIFQREAAGKELATAWDRQLAVENKLPKSMDGRTPNGPQLVKGLEKGR